MGRPGDFLLIDKVQEHNIKDIKVMLTKINFMHKYSF